MVPVMENDIVVNKGYEVLNLKGDQIYTFPDGLPGFDTVKEYCLLMKEEEAPFLRLSALGGVDLEFIVVSPWVALPGYNPEISDEDCNRLGLTAESQFMVLATVVVGQPVSESTVNLVAPIIINLKENKGRQVVVRNFKDYSSTHKMFAAV